MEILSPAGDMQCLIAAVQNGCDAVYLGLRSFSARANAVNFTYEELDTAVRYCHLRDVKVYLTLNTLISPQDMEQAVCEAYRAYCLGIDAVILQDVGLSAQIRKKMPGLRMHASTQMSVIHPNEALVLKEMGFVRIVAAREATIEQIQRLCQTGIEIEVFCHGSLCVSYSGQCLLSFFNGGKSGNKGSCAQPCRLAYSLYQDDKNILNGNLLSTKDISVMDHIQEISDAGAVSLKIEGRMKKPEYVALITSIYRKAVENKLTAKDHDDALQIFNREGFSESYLFSKMGKEMMAYGFSGNTGVEIGTVTGSNAEKALIQIESRRELINGDGISFLPSDIGMYVNMIKKNGSRYGLICRNGVPKVGEKVYMTFDKTLTENIQRTYAGNNRKVLINGKLTARINEPATLQINDNKGNRVTVRSKIVVQKAENAGANEAVIKNILKTGNTVFEFKEFVSDMDDSIFLPMSVVNELRRDALDKLKDMKEKVSFTPSEDLSIVLNKNMDVTSYDTDNKEKISLFFFEDRDDFNIADIDADRIYMPRTMYERYKADKRTYLYVPVGGTYTNKDERLISSSIGILDSKAEKVLDAGINCLNPYTLFELAKHQGLKAVTLSYELPYSEIKHFKDHNSDIDLEYVIYGRVAVMKTKYCIKGAFNGMPGCKKPSMYINDRQKKRIDIVTYCDCHTSYLLGAFVINRTSLVKEIAELGANTFRINIYNESENEIRDIIKKIRE